MSVNKVILVGNLGADPEVRTAQGGMMIAKLRLATNERRKSGDEWVAHVEWHQLVLFGRTAENVAKYLKKGSQAYFEGKLHTSKWRDREGIERWGTEVLVDVVRFLGSAKERTDARPASNPGDPNPSDYGYGGGANNDDDIPF